MMMLYAVQGFGKTTLASMSENPIIIQTEKGADDIGTPRSEIHKKWAPFLDDLRWLATADHNFKTLVIDSTTELEPAINADVCDEHDVVSIADIPYGKGPVYALTRWRKVLDACEYLRDVKGMSIIFISHAAVTRFNDPVRESYDRYSPRLDAKARDLLTAQVDEILFGNFAVRSVKEDLGFKKTRNVAKGGDVRVIHTCERASHIAKRRLELPDEIVLDDETKGANFWEIYEQARGEDNAVVHDMSAPVGGVNGGDDDSDDDNEEESGNV